MKIGRNDSCPCGSGAKYKRCCLLKRDTTASKSTPSQLPEPVRRAFAARQQSEAARVQKYGHVRAPITAAFQGSQFVAVGSRLFHDKNWKTFHDFLFAYPGGVFEKDWFARELQLRPSDRHPVIQWYQALQGFDAARRRPEQKGLVLKTDSPPAEISALLSFAYDLYTLENYSLLQQRLVKRLQHQDQFQGARYETYVAAALVRAGFTLQLEDETDLTSTHCEFVATHTATGRGYSVEAKSRHRSGYLGQAGEPKPLSEIQGDVRRLLISALRKNAAHDRLVFIDVNVPPSSPKIFETEWFNDVASQMLELEESPNGALLPPAFVYLTNFPYHFMEEGAPLSGSVVIFRGFNIPEFRVGHPDATVLPSKFPAPFLLHSSMLLNTAVPHELS